MKLLKGVAVGVVSMALALGGATPAGAAPIPEAPLSATDAPAVIRVGAPQTLIPMTIVTREDTWDHVYVLLNNRRLGGSYNPYGASVGSEPGRPRVHKLVVDLQDDALLEWGGHSWSFHLVATPGLQAGVGGGELDVEVRAHSMLGLAAATSSSTTTVRGSARAYNTVQDRYAAWSGRPVSVQRWTGSAWVQVAGASTDSRGNFTANVRVPAGSELRAVVKDVPAIWGAVSATAKA